MCVFKKKKPLNQINCSFIMTANSEKSENVYELTENAAALTCLHYSYELWQYLETLLATSALFSLFRCADTFEQFIIHIILTL